MTRKIEPTTARDLRRAAAEFRRRNFVDPESPAARAAGRRYLKTIRGPYKGD